MLVTRVEVEAPVTSFRFPHFLVGRQPTYEMPPLATLYGHLCSAVGEWVNPSALQIGYRFTYQGKVDDLEHQVIVGASGGKLGKTGMPKVLEGTVQPTRREFLFGARLTLYVSGDWSAAFRSPRYAVVLGRSQDLASYRTVEVLELQRADHAYYEHTLLPWQLRPTILRARAETMARYIDYQNGRRPYFDRFLILKDRIRTDRGDDWMSTPESATSHLVDPNSAEWNGLARGVWMHPLTAEDA